MSNNLINLKKTLEECKIKCSKYLILFWNSIFGICGDFIININKFFFLEAILNYFQFNSYPNLSCYLVTMIDIEIPKFIKEFLLHTK